MVVKVLKANQDPFFVQGYYAHRISILAQSKKVAVAIVAVSLRKDYACILEDLNVVEIFHGI